MEKKQTEKQLTKVMKLKNIFKTFFKIRLCFYCLSNSVSIMQINVKIDNRERQILQILQKNSIINSKKMRNKFV